MSSARNQRTLSKAATVEGIGLMLGVESSVTLKPADAGTGIVFVRTDLAEQPRVAVSSATRVTEVRRATGIQAEGVSLQTVEHMMSALAGLGVDNAVIEIDAAEPPIGDGSALPYVEAIQKAGIIEQNAPYEPIILTEPIVVENGDRQVG
ncbi:MAG: UDP-3-O-acyl-N-acetylglucosamine deacetylase, partial [Candidatus Poribacteria bacterium]|nr:UDP-3-O-acyl-N-acetylglucosamine deacetylase [Candidatus Poribacteria bacterium]